MSISFTWNVLRSIAPAAIALAALAFAMPRAVAQAPTPSNQTIVGGRVLGLDSICGACQLERFTTECHGRLEAPAFDRQGNLWVVGVSEAEVFRITPDGHCAVALHTPAPVGLRLHKDGRLFGVDSSRGVFWINTTTNEIHYITNQLNRTNFHGLDDLYFDSTGGLYLSDAFGSSVLHPVGQLFYMSADQKITRLVSENLAFPNGLVLSPDEKTLYVDDWNTNRILAIPVLSPGVLNIDFAYVFAYLNGGHGPDSMTADAKGNIYAAHYGAGEVVVFDPRGFYYGAIRLPDGAGLQTTNVAFHDGYLYITEMQQHTVWRVKTKIPGIKQFADQ